MSVFWTSIQSVLSIFIIIAIGYFCASRNWFDDKFSGSISKLIMNIALPASIFMSMLNFFKPNQLSSLSIGLLYVVLSVVIGFIVAYITTRVFKVSKGQRGIMTLAINGANTVFIGLPLNQALFGTGSIPYLLVYYIVNTIAIWTVGVWLIASDDPTNDNTKAKFDWHHLVPVPLWGFIIAIPVIYLIPNPTQALPTFITSSLTYIGNLVTPLALIYIGIMLQGFGLKNIKLDFNLNLTLFGRFIVSPLIMTILIVLGSHVGLTINPTFEKTLIVQAATPALSVLPILADTYHSDVKLATNIVVASSVAFIVVVPVIMMLLSFI